MDPDDIETDEWTMAMASAQCLRSIAICIGDGVVDIIHQYTTTNIVNPDWRLREAAVMAYGSIMDGPEEKLAPQLPLALPKLLELMVGDPALHVRDTAAWAVGTAYQLHSTPPRRPRAAAGDALVCARGAAAPGRAVDLRVGVLDGRLDRLDRRAQRGAARRRRRSRRCLRSSSSSSSRRRSARTARRRTCG
jgi:hypothetical protein